MKKKVLVLGAVTCVAGIVSASAAGCSSETVVTQNAVPDASPDTKRPPVEAGPEEDAGTCTKQVEVTKQTIEAEIGTYKPGKVSPGKCSTDDLTQFETNVKDPNLKEWLDLKTDLSADCAACIVTNTNDANWGPIVVNDEGAGFVNFGSCFGALETPECGENLQFAELCYDAACADCTADADLKACVTESSAAGGSCETFSTATDTLCKKLQTNAAKCQNAIVMAKTLCGGTLDGGTDAGDAADQ